MNNIKKSTPVVESSKRFISFQDSHRIELADLKTVLTFHLWIAGRRGNADTFLGKAQVDLSPLVSNFDEVHGWYHLYSHSGNKQGVLQVQHVYKLKCSSFKVKIKPTESLAARAPPHYSESLLDMFDSRLELDLGTSRELSYLEELSALKEEILNDSQDRSGFSLGTHDAFDRVDDQYDFHENLASPTHSSFLGDSADELDESQIEESSSTTPSRRIVRTKEHDHDHVDDETSDFGQKQSHRHDRSYEWLQKSFLDDRDDNQLKDDFLKSLRDLDTVHSGLIRKLAGDQVERIVDEKFPETELHDSAPQTNIGTGTATKPATKIVQDEDPSQILKPTTPVTDDVEEVTLIRKNKPVDKEPEIKPRSAPEISGIDKKFPKIEISTEKHTTKIFENLSEDEEDSFIKAYGIPSDSDDDLDSPSNLNVSDSDPEDLNLWPSKPNDIPSKSALNRDTERIAPVAKPVESLKDKTTAKPDASTNVNTSDRFRRLWNGTELTEKETQKIAEIMGLTSRASRIVN